LQQPLVGQTKQISCYALLVDPNEGLALKRIRAIEVNEIKCV